MRVPPYGRAARDRPRRFGLLITGSVALLVAVGAYNSLNCCPAGKRRPGIGPHSLATGRRLWDQYLHRDPALGQSAISKLERGGETE
jgi:hypothetical protein